MNAAVVIPWRPGCPWREQSLEWVTERLETTYGWPIVLGHCRDDLPFNRAEAILDGARRTDAEVIVVHDGDVWLDGDLEWTVSMAGRGHWAVPHYHLCRLTEEASGRVLGGEPLSPRLPLAQAPYRGNPTGTLVALHRDLLFDVPPDVRFVGWGQEDEAWWCALDVMVGRCHRGAADLYHLWHPPQKRMDRVRGNPEGVALMKRYGRAALNGREAMRDLIAEGVALW
ncbi:MAG: hypothetical protein ACOYOQ_00115 [Microthrixaceae bacterium]